MFFWRSSRLFKFPVIAGTIDRFIKIEGKPNGKRISKIEVN